MSVKFPENTPMTVPNLLRFVLQHTGHAPWEEESGTGAEASGTAGGGASGAAAAGVFSASGPRASLSAAFRPVEGETVGSRCTRTRCRPRMPSCRSRAGGWRRYTGRKHGS